MSAGRRRRRDTTSPTPPTPPAVSTAWLTLLKPAQLKAICWHYAALATGTPAQLARRIDPRRWVKADLQAHILTTLSDITPPTLAELTDMTTAFKVVSDAAVLAVLSPPSHSGQTTSASNTTTTTPESTSHGKDERESTANSTATSSSTATPNSTATSNSTASSTTPSRREANVAKKRRRSSHSDDEEDSPSDDSSADEDHQSNRRSSRRERHTLMVVPCPSSTCKYVAPMTAIPNFCGLCGTAWRPTTTATTAGPQKWKHLDHHVFTPLAALTTPSLRITTLGLLPESTIKKAREGQQHYTIADLLCPYADDGTSSVPEEDVVFIASASTGAVSRAMGTRASEARSLASRKRTIKSLDDIVEVFLFTLIPIIYEGRPDICEQLYTLLTIAVDICRNHRGDWNMALQYINGVRLAYWKQPGVQYKHVLNIDTTANLGRFDTEAYVSLVHHPAPSPPSSSGGGRAQVAGKPQDNPFKVCLDWNNKGTCTRQPCKFPHRCVACNGDHQRTSSSCPHHNTQQASATSRPSTPRPGTT
jgi:hypothetical protein